MPRPWDTQRIPSPGDVGQWSLRRWIMEMFRYVFNWTAVNFTVAIYGNIRQSGGLVPGTIDATWRDFGMDQITVAPRGCTFAAPGEFSVEYPGVYSLQTEFGMYHNSANAGRVFLLRVYNITDDAPSPLAVDVGVGRNVEVTNWTGNLLFEVADGDEGKLLKWQYSSFDSFSNVEFTTQSVGLLGVGEWRGPDPSPIANAG